MSVMNLVESALTSWQNAGPADYARAVCCIVLVGWSIRYFSGD